MIGTYHDKFDELKATTDKEQSEKGYLSGIHVEKFINTLSVNQFASLLVNMITEAEQNDSDDYSELMHLNDEYLNVVSEIQDKLYYSLLRNRNVSQ